MPPLNKIVELMTCGDTNEEIFPFLVSMLREIGMLPIVAHKESTGFVINRVWAAVKREVLTVLLDGVSTPEELDEVWTEMFVNTGTAPCRSMDAVGLDTVSFIEQHYIEERGLKDPGIIAYLQKYLDEGKLGAKSSKGGCEQYPQCSHYIPKKDLLTLITQCILPATRPRRATSSRPTLTTCRPQSCTSSTLVCPTSQRRSSLRVEFWSAVQTVNHPSAP